MSAAKKLLDDFSPTNAVNNWNIISLVAQVKPAWLSFLHTLETIVWTVGTFTDPFNRDAHAQQ
jgi:hypothetical protein